MLRSLGRAAIVALLLNSSQGTTRLQKRGVSLAQLGYDPSGDAGVHNDRDVAAYTQAISSGKKFIEKDHEGERVAAVEAEQAKSPYFMAIDEDVVKQTARQRAAQR